LSTGFNSIKHITLNTGDVRMSPRSGVDEGIMDNLVPTVAAVERKGEANLETPNGVMTLAGLAPNTNSRAVRVWTVRDGPPLVTIAVGDALWRELHDGLASSETVKTDRGQPPGCPWLAAMLHTGAALHPESDGITSWMGDFERCLAWTWIERFYVERSQR